MTINWTAVATVATVDFDEAVNKAAATIIMGVDDLMADNTTSRPAKLAILQQLGTTLSNREALIALLSGNVKTPAIPAGDPDGDLQDKLDAAKATVRQLEADRSALEEVLAVLGMSRLMPDAHYNNNTLRSGARTKVAELERVAASGVVPANFIDKTAARALAKKVDDEAKKVKTGWHRPGTESPAKPLLDAVEALNGALS